MSAADTAAELYSPVGRSRLAGESWLEQNSEDHISPARAKYYSDVAFQTDTNCSSNTHRRPNPKTFIRVEKDKRKESDKRLLRVVL